MFNLISGYESCKKVAVDVYGRCKSFAKRNGAKIAVGVGVAGSTVMARAAEGDFDASTAISGLGTSISALGTAGLALLVITLGIAIGIKFAKKIANKST